MARDPYESLVRFYEFQLGDLPDREALKDALRATLTEQDLQVFFLLPFFGLIVEEKLEKKAARAGIAPDELRRIARRLIPPGPSLWSTGACGSRPGGASAAGSACRVARSRPCA